MDELFMNFNLPAVQFAIVLMPVIKLQNIVCKAVTIGITGETTTKVLH